MNDLFDSGRILSEDKIIANGYLVAAFGPFVFLDFSFLCGIAFAKTLKMPKTRSGRNTETPDINRELDLKKFLKSGQRLVIWLFQLVIKKLSGKTSVPKEKEERPIAKKAVSLKQLLESSPEVEEKKSLDDSGLVSAGDSLERSIVGRTPLKAASDEDYKMSPRRLFGAGQLRRSARKNEK